MADAPRADPPPEEPTVTKRAQRKPPLHRLAMELKQWCEDRGVSQAALAMKLGISTSHLNQIIRGRARPSVALLRRIMVVLHGPRPALPKGPRGAAPRQPGARRVQSTSLGTPQKR
jgi:transcriptional regulator with XRE-family HTH domain